ncbi:MAG: hypothetical protein Q4A69_04425 [Moraxella sp.]|nr:hypothetical protein [Moraxella sp.]
MKVVKFSIALVAAALSTAAMANAVTDTVMNSGRTIFKTATNPAAVSVEVGTLGYGANIAWSANETAEVVAGWTGGKFDTDVTLDKKYADIDGRLKVDADLNNPYVGVNVRPFSNAFTVGTGVIFQDNNVSAILTPKAGGTVVKVKGREYVVNTGDLSIKAESGRDLAPYLTVGFKPNNNKRFGMFGELGAVYTGKWDTQVDIVGNVTGAGSAEDLKRDLSDKINKNNPEWYPVVKLGATYRF